MKRFGLSCLILFLLFIAASSMSHSQMLDPAIDKDGEPFSYFSAPTDVIGVMDGPQGTEVTPEGYLYTGFGEIMFFTGNPPQPVNQRVKTLLKGYLPVIEYNFKERGIEYAFEMFAATLDGDPVSPLMNFVRVKVRNENKNHRTAFLSIGTRYQNQSTTGSQTGDNRFFRPAKTKKYGTFEQLGVEFKKDWGYGFTGDAFMRDNKAMYLFPLKPKPALELTLRNGYNGPPDTSSRTLNVLPTTPTGIAQYALSLDAGSEQTLEFKIPYVPIAAGTPDIDALRKANYDEYLKKTISYWDNLINRGMEVNVPEEKVDNTFKASLVYDLIARNKIDSFYVQRVNDFQYHAFWLRDGSYIVRMYDVTGYPDIAKQCLDFFPGWQDAHGNFTSQDGQFDGWGQALWAYGEHFRITHDTAFAQKVFPAVQKAVEWLAAMRKEDALKLIPKTTPGDNEDITGHVTGHDFWALIGLKNIIPIAEAVGQKDTAAYYQRVYADMHACLDTALMKATAKTKGYITPGLDEPGGQDWDNMLSIYPEVLLDPYDPKVTATLNVTRSKYQEGIMTYGDGQWLHDYLTEQNTETELVRGQQEMAVGELYATLVHTSSTHAGFEYAVHPWGTRDFMQNLAPHGWFAAKYRELVRNMMVREQDGNLHLLSCVTPEWVKPGKSIAVKRAPTNFGTVNFTETFNATGADISFDNSFSIAPDTIYVHIPWFVKPKKVTTDGKAAAISSYHGDWRAAIPVYAKHVHIDWARIAGAKPMNYDLAVKEYKKEYKERWDKFLATGRN